MRINTERSLYEKLTILTDAAKYDVACTSSGVDRVSHRESAILFPRTGDVFRF